jgi:hypothetical protein
MPPNQSAGVRALTKRMSRQSVHSYIVQEPSTKAEAATLF